MNSECHDFGVLDSPLGMLNLITLASSIEMKFGRMVIHFQQA